jgi:hypothetical protein
MKSYWLYSKKQGASSSDADGVVISHHWRQVTINHPVVGRLLPQDRAYRCLPDLRFSFRERETTCPVADKYNMAYLSHALDVIMPFVPRWRHVIILRYP